MNMYMNNEELTMALYFSENSTWDLELFANPDWYEDNIFYNLDANNTRKTMFNYTIQNIS